MTRNEQLLEYVKKGKNLSDIARMFGISRQRVWQIANPKKHSKMIKKYNKAYYHRNKEYRNEQGKQNYIRRSL